MNFYGIYFQNTASPCLKSPQFFNWKKSTPNRSMKEPEFKERIIHNFQVLPSMGFDASHSAFENVVVITGKLYRCHMDLKAGLNSESHYQQFYFLVCFSAHHAPPPACLGLSFCFYLFSFSSTFFLSHPILPHWSLSCSLEPHILKPFL